ncbi:sugar ABC transporter permease [Paenibacillus sp. PAMC21692]|uniref:ABC transporter permease n=1 Tax=Paenibacillus sp. PAMC21692 TaxID=2762320 RepID=UPI00164CFF47|nr:ABC transporter permease subunit [Paenibacillus sp. PAMC21692]QNK58944.1 sugar ABC transporter permease [Paenibacillus sp. PAMC21692]
METRIDVAGAPRAKMNKKLSEGNLLLLLAVPSVLFVFVFSYVPLAGWIYAFLDYTPGIPLSKDSFVGTKYFTMMFDSDWSQVSLVLRNTLVLSFMGLLITPLPVAFAILLNEVAHPFFRKFVQTVTTLPNFISWIIVYGLFFSLFSMEGMLNSLFVKLGIFDEAQNILGNESIAWFLQTGLGVWKTVGWGAIIYLAAIASIDQELYDAAKVDGAGRWNCIRHITVPSILTTYFVMLLLSISGILSNGFEQFYVFNNSLVAGKLEVLDLYVYNMGIVYGQYSYSIAIGIWKTFISILLLMTANQISKKSGESIFSRQRQYIPHAGGLNYVQ